VAAHLVRLGDLSELLEIEADRERWSVTHLERQIHTELFARLLKSRDRAGVMDLASRGQILERPANAIQHPYVLDFLDLPESPKLRESDLETAILEKLQQFLLELGKGFAFVARRRSRGQPCELACGVHPSAASLSTASRVCGSR
jgi:predicted nuclease of restriction endonuclease-like (RecB) superfamily